MSGNTSQYQMIFLIKNMVIMAFLFLVIIILPPVTADGNIIQINPVGNHHLGERFTISGSIASMQIHRIMITFFSKSCWDSFIEFVTITGDTSIYTAESTPYLNYGGEYSYTNPDGSVTQFGRPQCPSESYNDNPSIRKSNGKLVWDCSINGTIGDRIMKPGTYVVRVIDPDSGEYTTAIFSLEKKIDNGFSEGMVKRKMEPDIHSDNQKYSINFLERFLIKKTPVPRNTIGPVNIIAGYEDKQE